MELKFPENFLWGSVTAAYQVEGGNKFSDWEVNPPKGGHGPAGAACDHYHRFREDFDLAKNLNQNTHRLSIEWARIEPREGEFSQKEIEHYREVFEALKERGFKIMLTLHHFSLPIWFAKKGGFEKRKNIFYFQRFAEKVFEEYKDLVDFWITINEPNVYAGYAYIFGAWLPQKHNPFLYFKVIDCLISAHKAVYKSYHQKDDNVLVGLAKNNVCFEPNRKHSILDKLVVSISRSSRNNYVLEKIKNNQDFIGLNYYSHAKISFPFLIRNDNEIISDRGDELYPQGIYHVLKDLKKYKKPIYIIENGLADKEDKHRAWYIKETLKSIHKAIKEGVDVRGYLHWSLLDNFEWAFGFEMRYGLIEIDYKTLERRPRPSAYYYAEICKNNGII